MSMISHFVTRIFKDKPIPFSFILHLLDGEKIEIGQGDLAFQAYIRTSKGEKALTSFNQLNIANAYIEGDIDIEGDLIEALSLQVYVPDNNFLIKTWRVLKPKLFGREKCNPEWISLHYDSNNIQLVMLEDLYHTYTPGIYLNESETPEESAVHKMAYIEEALQLKQGDRLLDVGSGWGGVINYFSDKGMHVTGITLSDHQRQFTQDKIDQKGLNAEVHYQDFFTFEPKQKYDGITMMGVIEDLADYEKVMDKLMTMVKPGGRIYLDFASDFSPNNTSSYITEYIWPGTFRMVYMPEFMAAIADRPIEVVRIDNDRRNYYLWTKKVNQRWEEKKEEIVAREGETLWKIYHLMIAGVASIMNSPTHATTAFRVVLEMPEDAQVGRLSRQLTKYKK